jgi:hypothetical protein
LVGQGSGQAAEEYTPIHDYGASNQSVVLPGQFSLALALAQLLQNHGLVWSASLALSSPDKQDMRLDLPGSSLESRKSPCYCVLAARARGGVISGAGTQDPVWLYSRSPLCTSHREQFSHPISSGPTAGPIGRTYPGPGWRWSPGLRSCWSREWPGAAAV